MGVRDFGNPLGNPLALARSAAAGSKTRTSARPFVEPMLIKNFDTRNVPFHFSAIRPVGRGHLLISNRPESGSESVTATLQLVRMRGNYVSPIPGSSGGGAVSGISIERGDTAHISKVNDQGYGVFYCAQKKQFRRFVVNTDGETVAVVGSVISDASLGKPIFVEDDPASNDFVVFYERDNRIAAVRISFDANGIYFGPAGDASIPTFTAAGKFLKRTLRGGRVLLTSLEGGTGYTANAIVFDFQLDGFIQGASTNIGTYNGSNSIISANAEGGFDWLMKEAVSPFRLLLRRFNVTPAGIALAETVQSSLPELIKLGGSGIPGLPEDAVFYSDAGGIWTVEFVVNTDNSNGYVVGMASPGELPTTLEDAIFLAPPGVYAPSSYYSGFGGFNNSKKALPVPGENSVIVFFNFDQSSVSAEFRDALFKIHFPV